LIDEDSSAFAKESGITPRECEAAMASMSREDIVSELEALKARLDELMKAAEAL
jgi:hypothetical protein